MNSQDKADAVVVNLYVLFAVRVVLVASGGGARGSNNNSRLPAQGILCKISIDLQVRDAGREEGQQETGKWENERERDLVCFDIGGLVYNVQPV